MLRAVNYNGKIYFSRHKPDGDWFKNALTNSEVTIEYNNFVFSGNAKLVTDEELSKKISQLKYPGEERAKEKRVTIEVTLDSKWVILIFLMIFSNSKQLVHQEWR